VKANCFVEILRVSSSLITFPYSLWAIWPLHYRKYMNISAEHSVLMLRMFPQGYTRQYGPVQRSLKEQHLCEYASIEYTFCYMSETAVSFLMFTVQLSGHKNPLNASVKAFFLEWVFPFLQNRLHKDLMPYSLAEVYWCLEDICYHHIQDLKVNQVIKQRASRLVQLCKMYSYGCYNKYEIWNRVACLFTQFTLWPWKWKQQNPPNCW
jgi:hypothetical protein